jgi:helicase
LRLSELPIPKELAEILESKGYKELYPPQERAIKLGVLEGESLLITTPTASGKTLIALLASSNKVVQGKKVVYLTPLRALANEKYEEFKVLESLKRNGEWIRVGISTGDYDSPGESLAKYDVIVVTNERFDSLIRHNVSWLDEVGLYVADEIHLVGDYDRGPTLEVALTRIRTMAKDAQLIALSATVKNAKHLEKWLGIKLVSMNWRPVPLVEGIYSHGVIMFSDNSLRKIMRTNRGEAIDLAIDCISNEGQALIFAETRKRAVSLAVRASELTRMYLKEDEAKNAKELSQQILEVGEETELSRLLSKTVECGSAFHHAGLSSPHRRIVENGFKKGIIKLVCATPTLAAGVNLPARRVIIASLWRYDPIEGRSKISVLEYKQMCGRAGRPQFDDYGETIIVAPSKYDAEEIVYEYVKGEPEPIRSQLSREAALRTHVLSTIVSLPGIDRQELNKFFSKTLFAYQYSKLALASRLGKALNMLISENLVEKRKERFLATEFGKRISMLYIDPKTGIEFKKAIELAKRGEKHEVGILHIIATSEDFYPKLYARERDYEQILQFLDEHKEELIVKPPSITSYHSFEEYLQSFRAVMVLWAWINEYGEEEILARFGVEPGDLHRATETAEWLCYAFSELCKLFGNSELYSESIRLHDRIKHGVKGELLQLVGIEGVGRVRARVLYSAGIRSLKDIQRVSLERLASLPKIGFTLARKIKEKAR